ncbi:hypothetical protein HAX54_038305 [Datura stramonium]|uniref:Uncharacterized protein n=1 Tax=Datura stramonium TaxID=4076 RepID=A0ABS8VJN2_DATST|nr:hypothetical protein [Datura stramonium]
MDFKCSDLEQWKEALSAYEARIESLNKPKSSSLLDVPTGMNFPPFSVNETLQMSKYMYLLLIIATVYALKYSGLGCWIFVSSLDDAAVRSASEKAFQSLPDIKKAISELTVLKGVGPATASAVLAAYAPDVAPFMSDEYLVLVDKLQAKAKELSAKGDCFTPSDVERALWSSAVGVKSGGLSQDPKEVNLKRKSKRKRAQ